jgi:hypothetical protein
MQRANTNIEKFGGSLAVIIAFHQSSDDSTLFRVFRRRLKRSTCPMRLGTDFAGQILLMDHFAIHGDYDSLNQVPQLTDITRPTVANQDLDCFIRETLAIAVVTSAELLQEVVYQERYVFAPLAQGRNLHWNHVQPVVQVFSKLPFANKLLDIPVSR